MTREIIEDYRKIILPFMKKKLLEINYENQGESDADEFEKDFNEILNLSAKTLEQKPVLDKIRAEIEELRFGQPLRKYVVDECLEIIDKYKAESEG